MTGKNLGVFFIYISQLNKLQQPLYEVRNFILILLKISEVTYSIGINIQSQSCD